MKTSISLLAWAVAATNAHMIMKTPTPAGAPTSSPLDGTGANYPCQGADVASGTLNTMAVGSSQTLSFTGSAVHGGGSCQISLAEGTSPTKDTKFMVIHSIEGGCPANVPANIEPADPNGSGAATFQFSIPDHPDIKPGSEYTLAWTWNNKVGNREFYMNCARVKVEAPAKKRYAPSNMPISKRQQAPLPAMFVANIGNGCTTAEGIDVQYPNPGESLEQAKNAKLGALQGNCGAVGAASPPAGSSASSAASPATSAVVSSAPVASNSVSAVASATGNANPGQYTQSKPGVFATDSASLSSSAASQSPAASSASAVASSAAPATPASSAAAPVGTGPSSSTTPSTGTCEVGAWDCAADGKSFTRCVAGGTWSASIPMAAGMSCTPGVSMNFAYNASVGSHAKRDLRSHLARRQHNLHGPALS